MAQHNRIRCVLMPWMFRGQGIFVRRQQTLLQKIHMAGQYIRRLKFHIPRLHDTILALKEANPPLEIAEYQEIIDILIEHETGLFQWGNNLCDDIAMYLWSVWDYTLSRAKRISGHIMTSTNILLLILEDTKTEMNSNILYFEALAKKCHQRSKNVMIIMQRLKEIKIHVHNETGFYSLAPHTMARVLWLGQAAHTRIEFVPLPNELPQMPAVIYRPIPFHFLFSIVVQEFDRSIGEHGQAFLRLRPATDGAELCLTMQGFTLMPDMWERLRRGYAYEWLYEIGGTLEPLTWDEGYGQGVILCLPWAQAA